MKNSQNIMTMLAVKLALKNNMYNTIKLETEDQSAHQST